MSTTMNSSNQGPLQGQQLQSLSDPLGLIPILFPSLSFGVLFLWTSFFSVLISFAFWIGDFKEHRSMWVYLAVAVLATTMEGSLLTYKWGKDESLTIKKNAIWHDHGHFQLECISYIIVSSMMMGLIVADCFVDMPVEIIRAVRKTRSELEKKEKESSDNVSEISDNTTNTSLKSKKRPFLSLVPSFFYQVYLHHIMGGIGILHMMNLFLELETSGRIAEKIALNTKGSSSTDSVSSAAASSAASSSKISSDSVPDPMGMKKISLLDQNEFAIWNKWGQIGPIITAFNTIRFANRFVFAAEFSTIFLHCRNGLRSYAQLYNKPTSAPLRDGANLLFAISFLLCRLLPIIPGMILSINVGNKMLNRVLMSIYSFLSSGPVPLVSSYLRSQLFNGYNLDDLNGQRQIQDALEITYEMGSVTAVGDLHLLSTSIEPIVGAMFFGFGALNCLWASEIGKGIVKTVSRLSSHSGGKGGGSKKSSKKEEIQMKEE